MARQIEEISIEEYRAKYENRNTRGRTTRPDIPAAPRQAATGLSTLTSPKAGSGRPAWSVESPDAVRYRLYVINQPALDTGLCATELDACNKAKRLEAAQC
jgi:hypothetical protein